jgi:hypothetical protein
MVVPLDGVAYLALKDTYFGFQYSLKFRRIVVTEKNHFSLKESSVQQGVRSVACESIYILP